MSSKPKNMAELLDEHLENFREYSKKALVRVHDIPPERYTELANAEARIIAALIEKVPAYQMKQ